MKFWIKRNLYRYRNINKNLQLGVNVMLNMKCEFEGWNVVEDNCEISTSKIGLLSYICAGSVIRFTYIGRFCSIGRNLQTGLGMHPTNTFVSTHPAFFSASKQAGLSFVNESIFEENKFVDKEKKWVVYIGNDVWIGNNVTIMDGLTIGDGAIIAAGAVITNNVDPYAIVVGIPGKIKKYRFSQKEISALLNIKWWNWDLKRIKSESSKFSDIESFIEADAHNNVNS